MTDIHGCYTPDQQVPDDIAARARPLAEAWCARNNPQWHRGDIDRHYEACDAHNAAVTSEAPEDRPIVDFIGEVRGNLHAVALYQAFRAMEATPR